MTAEEVYRLIDMNKVSELQICTSDDAKLCEIACTGSDNCIEELRNILPSLSSYKRIVVRGRRISEKRGEEGKRGATAWINGFRWNLDIAPGASSELKINSVASPSGSIGAMEYIASITQHMQKQFDLQSQLLELKMEQKNNDPTKWIPIIQAGMGFFNGEKPNAIAGKQTLEFGDIKTLSKKELDEKMCTSADSLDKKIKLSEMCEVLDSLDRNPNITSDIGKIIKLLNVIIEKPQLLNSAMAFI